MQTLLTAVEHASRQSDRYLFLAAIVSGAFGFWWLFRWLVGQYTEINRKMAETIERNNQALVNNTQALKEVTQEITFCRSTNRSHV